VSYDISMYNGQRVGGVIVAAGEGKRMGGIDKMTALLDGIPVLVRVVETFRMSALVDRLAVVLNPYRLEEGHKLLELLISAESGIICAGGKRRQDSVAAGLDRLTDCEWVVIHDGARPLVTADLIERGLDSAQDTGAAIAAVPVKDTIKEVTEDRLVKQTLSRQQLWAVQTPQVFRYDIIVQAHRRAVGEFTDDAAMVESNGGKVKVYPGADENIKITTPEDLVLAECMLKKYAK
jgi:2-C-methyl-D-erythritol 4-phosphate cytidylyltransferase